MAGAVQLVFGGSVFFPSLFYLAVFVLRQILAKKYDNALIYTVALRFVSTVQAILACTSGFIIIYTCKNVLYDRHWLATSYVWFGVPYFYYDTWAMYVVHWHKHPELQDKPAAYSIKVFMKSQPLMMLHHLVLPAFYLPVIVYFRGDVGDFFVGCLYCLELAIPCISLRAILLQLGREKSLLYNVNGILLIVTFALCRVLIFPFMYWCYGLQQQLSILQVIQAIPNKCNVGCALLLFLQLYWLCQMLTIFLQTIWSRWIRPALFHTPPKEA